MNETLNNANYVTTPRSFSEAITVCLSKYATFKGRASRSEFWWFYLFYLSLIWGVTIVGAFSGLPDILPILVNLAFVLPLLAANARRLHDIGRSGWWFLLPLTLIGAPVLIYWLAQPGNPTKNEYDIQSQPTGEIQ